MTRVIKLEWVTASCPICGETYDYLIAFKPPTCSKFDCVREFQLSQTEEEKEEKEGGDK